MTTGLKNQLNTYFSDLDAGQGPVTVDDVVNLIDKVREVTVEPVTTRSTPRVWIAAVAAVAVFVVLGSVSLLLVSTRNSSPPASDTPLVTTVPDGAPTTTGTADVSTTVASSPETTLPGDAIPATSPGESWQLVGVGDDFGAGTWIGGVVDAQQAGVIAVGTDQEPWPVEAVVWRSHDLVEWSRQTAGTGLMQSVAVADGTIVAVGYDYYIGTGDWSEDRQIVWVFDDAASSWNRLEADGVVFGSGQVWRVAAGGPGFIAAGRTCVGPVTNADERAEGKMANCDLQSMTVWGSVDGHTWNRMWVDEPSSDGAGIYDIEVFDDGFMISGAWNENNGQGSAVVWISSDAFDWTRVLIDDERTEQLSGQVTVATAVAKWRSGFVAVGWESDSNDIERLAVVWVSRDGVSWERVTGLPNASEVRLWGLTVSGERLFAVGGLRTDDESSESNAVVWQSDDGLAWIDLDVRDDGSMWAVTSLNWGDPTRTGIAAVGTSPAGQGGAIWVSPTPR